MHLNVSFPRDIELILRDRAAAAGKDVETFVQEIVTSEIAEERSPKPNTRSHQSFVTELRAMIERHGIKNGKFDDSRESIYAGRGERAYSSTRTCFCG